MKPVSEVTAGELARAMKWRADDHRARSVEVVSQQMVGPHEELILATAIAALLGQGYSYAELSTAYNAIVSDASSKSRIGVGDSLTITEIGCAHRSTE